MARAKRRRNKDKKASDRSENKATNQVPRDDDRVIIRDNESFKKYYRSQEFIKDDLEFEKFMECLRQPLPAAFRINTFDLNQAKFLRHLVQEPEFNQVVARQPTKLDESCPIELAKVSALLPLSWYPENFAFQMNVSRVDLRKTPILQKLHKFLMAETENGFISRQEAVSMVPPLVLDVHRGQNVLDMCAAPGSKTAQLLEYLKRDIKFDLTPQNEADESVSDDLFDDGMVVANDVDNKRCYMLVHQSSRLNSPNCIITNQDASKLPDMMMTVEKDGINKKTKLKFDRILCDVPCSGDGTARKNVDVWRKWNIQNGNNFHRMQSKILRRGLELLKEGGHIVYSTCSLNPVENEAVIASILRESKGTVVLEDIETKVPTLKYRPGVSIWTVMDRDLNIIQNSSSIPQELATQIHPDLFHPTEDEAKVFQLNKCLRILPHLQNTGAFFLACLKKLSDKLPWEKPETIETIDMSNPATDHETKASSEKPHQDPKKRRFKGFKEDPFFFLGPNDPDWLAIKDGFGLGSNFPVEQLVHRCVSGNKRSIYLVSKRTRNFIETNSEKSGKIDFVKIINGGMRLFSRAASETGFRLCQDGVNEVLPYITKELMVDIDRDDLIALLKARTVPFDVFSCSSRVKDKIKLGSFILLYRHQAVKKNEETCVTPLVAWRGEYTVSLYVTNTYKIHLAALVGIDFLDFQ